MPVFFFSSLPSCFLISVFIKEKMLDFYVKSVVLCCYLFEKRAVSRSFRFFLPGGAFPAPILRKNTDYQRKNLLFPPFSGSLYKKRLSPERRQPWITVDSVVAAATEHDHDRENDDPSAVIVKKMAKAVVHMFPPGVFRAVFHRSLS